MATTTNYGWTTPDNTDAVTNGALAIRTLAGEIDSTVSKVAGKWLSGGTYVNTSGNSTNFNIGVAEQVAFVPFVIPNDVTLASVSVNVTDTQTVSSYLGVYSASATTYLPTSLIVSFGSFSGSSTGAKTITTTQALSAGVYWFAVKLNSSVSYSLQGCREGASNNYLYATSSDSLATLVAAGSAPMCLVGTDAVTGALATSAPATLTISRGAPVIAVKVA